MLRIEITDQEQRTAPRRSQVGVAPEVTWQVGGPCDQMLVLSGKESTFYLCKAWVHKDDIDMGFQVHLIIIYPYGIIKTLFEDWSDYCHWIIGGNYRH